MEKIRGLGQEVKDNAGKGGWSWDWLDRMLGKWGSVLVKAGISALIVLIVAFLLACGIVPILRRQCQRCMDKQMGAMANLQLARMMNMMTIERGTKAQFAQMVVGRPDLFPIPDYLEESDEMEETGLGGISA
ncbi:hypothetical protein VZT92_008317 [Zoarces viviparus]|uniref:Uncharacterized protein n=1 Tax=Zoarces viviparus TaxID=48416 RepID=A0AAW1FF28_ZOAVI